jgi:hypothetical protein
MTPIVITVAIWIIIPLVYVIYNLYNKNKKMEDIILNQRIFVRDFLTMSRDFSRLVDKIDMTIWTSSDPELQDLFEKIKSMKSILDGYEEN